MLYQDFTVPSVLIGAVLTFDSFTGNRAVDFFTPSPASLGFSTPELNQQARVDIVRAGSDPFSVSSSDVVLNLFQTNPGDPLISGYTSHGNDLAALFAAHAAETLRLRFAEVDNVFIFQLGVDDVSLVKQSIPQPHTLSLLIIALAATASLGCAELTIHPVRVGGDALYPRSPGQQLEGGFDVARILPRIAV